jgi:DNA-binding SARP family transcriptional activator
VVSPAPVRIELLDGFAVRRAGSDGREVPLPPGVQRLVAHLALSGRPTRSAVAGVLWPGGTQGEADRNLRSTLWRLRKAVPELVEGCGGALALADAVAVDARELDGWARRVLQPVTAVAEPAVPEAAWRGELLPGWDEDWVLVERERLRRLRVSALETVVDALACSGRFALAAQVAYAAVRAEPLRESAHRTLVRVHLAEGNTAEALRAYERYRELLADELGLPPSPRMRLLREELAAAGAG